MRLVEALLTDAVMVAAAAVSASAALHNFSVVVVENKKIAAGKQQKPVDDVLWIRQQRRGKDKVKLAPALIHPHQRLPRSHLLGSSSKPRR